MTGFGSISELLDELAPVVRDERPAWDDVLARAAVLGAAAASDGRAAEAGERAAAVAGGRRSRLRLPRRRLVLVAVALFALAVVVVAAAYVLGHPVIDFGKAQKGSRKVVDDFGSLQVGAPSAAMAPGVLPKQARVITTVRIDGKPHTLYVAPTKKGGFCSEWSQWGGGCRADRHDKFARHIGLSVAVGSSGMTGLDGDFFQADGARLEVTYADGQADEIPFVWVTAPINAGFFLFRIPDAHRHAGHQPVAVTLYDNSNNVVVREQVRGGQGPREVMRRLPGYGPLLVPKMAEWAKRTQLFAWRAWDGARIGLWIAPERGGGSCFWTKQAGGCSEVGGHPGHGKLPPLMLSPQGGAAYVTLCCNVSTKIARVEARFADGDRIELTPKQGYLVWPIPRRHYPLGHRLTELVGYDAAGRAVATDRPPRNERGVYPCAKPKNFGYGVRMCP